MLEKGISDKVRAEASRKGIRLWRNNVGCVLVDGRYIRFGLANESRKQNAMIKSSDLIGIKPVTITPDMVGTVIGQFICRETKKENWKFSQKDKTAIAQKAWLDFINSMGGDAKFATGEGTL